MTTKRALQDQIDAGLAWIEALKTRVAEGDRATLDELAATLRECNRLTKETASISGVPKIEIPLLEWREIEAITTNGPDDSEKDGRRRARRVIRGLEAAEAHLQQIRQRLVILTGTDGTLKR